jgi:hypothetical protein
LADINIQSAPCMFILYPTVKPRLCLKI